MDDSFTLQVDHIRLDAFLSIEKTQKTSIPTDSTPVESTLPKSGIIDVLDLKKNPRKWIITMRDTIGKPLPPKPISFTCHWCHMETKSVPLGCPFRRIEERKSTFSATFKRAIWNPDPEYVYYETEGLFCHWNCVFAMAESIRHRSRESPSLTLLLARESGYTKSISHAAPFSIRSKYGGTLNDREYKERYLTDSYDPTKNRYIPCISSGEIYELSSKF